MNGAVESPEAGRPRRKETTERFGVSTLGFATGKHSEPSTPNPLAVGMSSSALLRRPRSRREVKQVQKLFVSLQKREEGQTMAEYGVVLAVITALVFGALSLLSGNIINAITRVAGYIS